MLLLRQAFPPPVAPQPHRLPLQRLLVAPSVPHPSLLLPLLAVVLALFHQFRLAVFLRLLTLPRALPLDHLVSLGHVSLVLATQRNGRPSSRPLLRMFHHHLTVRLRHLIEMAIIGAPHAIVLVLLLQVSCGTSPPRMLAKSWTTPCARSLLPSTASLVLTHLVAGFGEQALAIAIAVCKAQTRDHLALEISSQGLPVLFPALPHRLLRKLQTPPPPPRARRRILVASFPSCSQRTSQTAYANYRRTPWYTYPAAVAFAWSG